LIPNAAQLEVIAQMSRGNLSETSYPVLLHALAVHRRSVVLEIQRRQLQKRIVIEVGMPVDCQSNLLHETLGKFMVARGDLTEDQLQLLQSRAITGGQPLAELLVAEGAVPASELYKILQQNLAKKLLDGFSWREGDFRIITDIPPVESPLRVKTPQLVITGITKLVPDTEIEKEMEPILQKKLKVNPQPAYPTQDLRLTGEHQLLMELLSEGRLADDVIADMKKPRDKVLRLLYSLSVIGMIVPEEWLPAEPVVASPDMDFMLPMPEADTSTPVVPKDTLAHPEELRNQVMNFYLRYRKLDAFDLLDLYDSASKELIEQKYIEFSEKYAPWKFQDGELSELADKARELFLAGGRAFGELNDAENRNSLIARRQNLLGPKTVEFSRDQFLIKSDLLDSETQFKKGKELMAQGKYHDAIQQLQFAHDCDPQNPIYRAELAYCRYLHEPETKSADALAELNEALRIDPQCGLAAYYAGVIHSDQGNFIEAEVYLQNSNKLLKGDRRPVEALKALQGAKGKPKKKLF
jgi:hypothetical protein